ncbi:MAG: hypothetical protein JO150_13805 [Acidobacteriaceae bacterium]|nr:hypothetical protein [Acidobacteriaceae bacterium]
MDAARHRRFYLAQSLLFYGSEVAGVSSEGHLQGLRQILQQVEAVGHLHGLGCAVAGPFGIGTGAIARKDRHAGVFAQPSG